MGGPGDPKIDTIRAHFVTLSLGALRGSKWSQNGLKMEPKWEQNGTKIEQNGAKLEPILHRNLVEVHLGSWFQNLAGLKLAWLGLAGSGCVYVAASS